MQLDRRIQTGLAATAAVAAVLSGVSVLAILAMTHPAIATPVTRAAIGAASGRETHLERAQLKLAWPLGFEMRGLQIAADAAPVRMAAIDMRVNPFGFLPAVSFLPMVTTSDGELSARLGGDQSGATPAWLTEIDRLDAEAIRITVAREGRPEPDLFIIDSASGRLAGGDLTLTGRGGGATVFFNGGLAGPFVQGLRGAVTIRGENLAEFADLLGLAAPDTPPYEWNAELSSGVNVWRLNGITGTVGDSDLSGDIEVTLGRERPFIQADLHSDSLDFDDVGLFVGAPTQIDGEEANALQAATNEAYQQSDRLIPDATLDLARVRAVDAEVSFDASSVRAGGFPLDAVFVEMTLDDGVMRFDPLEFTIAQGHFRSTINIDASGDTVVTNAVGNVDGVQLSEMAQGRIGTGEIEGQFELALSGDNLRVAAASADGAAGLWVRDGAISALAEEAADLDLLEALIVLVSQDPANPELTPLHCGVVRFNAQDGVARAEPIVFDSADTLLAVEGYVDFSDEAVELDINADNKDFSWGQLLGDIRIEGSLRRPHVTPELGPAVVQGGIAALLGAIAAPLAALPFINPDERDEDAPCGQLLAEAQAPAPTGQPTAAAAAEADARVRD